MQSLQLLGSISIFPNMFLPAYFTDPILMVVEAVPKMLAVQAPAILVARRTTWFVGGKFMDLLAAGNGATRGIKFRSERRNWRNEY